MHPVAKGGSSLSVEKRLEQVERIVSSRVLRNSEALCNLLKFLARHSIDSPDTSVKEHQIALEVFGRSPDFDPRLDSTVRVQMGRLRTKLFEYYSSFGRNEPIIVEIPKGSHTVTFRRREMLPVSQSVGISEHPRVIRAPAGPWKFATLLLSAVVVALLLVLLLTFPAGRVQSAVNLTNDPLSIFWRGFLQSVQEPLVVFSNAEFVGRPETGLRYYREGKDASELVFDHYTGVGEVISIHELDQVFARLHRPIQVKRGRLLNWDDAKDRDLVFLGSPSENLSLREMSLGKQFRFQTAADGPRKGDLGIVNVHPGANEPAVFFGSRGLPITEDYAVAELVQGPTKAQILLLAGTTTFGTQGAVEFVCDPDRIHELLPRIRNASGNLGPFAALLRIKVNRGVPVEGEVVALRRW